ncbi:hypothetical protein [Streptomyces griseoluteus]|uniref:hypothetical protein n=1 Tax=Streptomyces griseoluteus TaxID=29306 RepID=UPI00341209A8
MKIFFLGILEVLIGIGRWFVLVVVAARLRSPPARPEFRRRGESTTGRLFIGIGIGWARASDRPSDWRRHRRHTGGGRFGAGSVAMRCVERPPGPSDGPRRRVKRWE